jgi:hypothetical protein
MSTTESKIPQAEVLLTYSEAAIKNTLSKYSFKFTVDGVDCRVCQDPDNNNYRYFDCGNAAELLSELAAQIEQSIKGCGSKTHIDILDLRKFAIKHIQAMIKVEQAFEEAPESERQYKMLNLRLIDRESLSPAEQCALEVMKEGGKELKKLGTIIGMPDDEIVDVDTQTILAKQREKTEKPNESTPA